MKRILTVLLIVLMIFTFAACGSPDDSGNTAAKNEITGLFDQGYVCTANSADETIWKGIFQPEDSFETVYVVTAPITADDYEAYTQIDFDDEDGVKAFLGALTDVNVQDITDMLPTQDDLDALVGKTFGDLENEGFESTGWSGDPDMGYSFYYDGPVYCCSVTPAEGTVIEDMDDYSANDIRALEIGSVEFIGVSGALLDNFSI